MIVEKIEGAGDEQSKRESFINNYPEELLLDLRVKVGIISCKN